MAVSSSSMSGTKMVSFLNSDAPVKNQCEQLSALSQLECVASTAAQGIEDILSGNLGSFDPLVGENACQLRMGQIYDMALFIKENPGFKQGLAKEKQRIEQILCKIKQYQKAIQALSLQAFATELELNGELSEEAALITRFVLLSKTKKMTPVGVVIKEDSDEKPLMNQFGLTRTAARSMIKDAQEKLSETSVAYLQKESALIHEAEPKLLRELIGPSFVQCDTQKRKMAPFMLGVSVILKRMIEKQQPILVTMRLAKGEKGKEKVQEVENLLFHAKNGRLVQCPIQEEDHETPACVIEGYALHSADSGVILGDLKTKLLETGLQTAILANAAAHPQYPGCKKQEVPVDDLIEKKREKQDEESVYFLEKMKRKTEKLISIAETEGYGEKNPSVFCIDHIFCDRIGAQVKKS